MCGRKDPLWHDRWAEKLVWVRPVKAILSAKDGESGRWRFGLGEGWLQVSCHGRRVRSISSLVLNMRCVM
jgi:hypothetical protein